MKTYTCVCTIYEADGRTTCEIVGKRTCETKPRTRYAITNSRDIYNDWFETEADAQKYIASVLNQPVIEAEGK